MTAGQEALIEAMRLEQGRIYGQLSTAFVTEKHAAEAPESTPPRARVTDIRLARAKKGAA